MGSTDLFAISEPEAWNYSFYQFKGRELTFFLSNPRSKSHLWIVFQNVVYYEGSTQWTGGIFRLGSSEECSRLIHQLQVHHMAMGIEQEDWNEIHLYERDKEDSRDCIRVLASDAHLRRDLPTQWDTEPS